MKRRDFIFGTVSALALTGSPRSWAVDSVGIDNVAGPAKGPWRRLFLDGSVVEATQGLERVFHSTTKHATNPVISRDQPWEGTSAITGPYVYGTVLKEAGRLRLWYQLLSEGNHIGYAESDDGISWIKPKLDAVRTKDGQRTNLVVSALSPEKFANTQCHNPSVITNADAKDPARRYALYGFDGTSRGPRVAWSADGIHFQYDASSRVDGKAAPLFASSDVVSFFEDPYEQRICATWKTRNRRGRAVGVAASSDGLQWNKLTAGPVFAADDLDPDTTQIYGMPVFAYQGLYIGLPWIYAARYFRYGDYSVEKLHEAQADSPRTIEPQIAWSWDLVSWTRPAQRAPFIIRGERGEWDSGMIVTSRAPVVMGDELWFYYGGTDKVHDEPRVKAAIGLARLRLDGFCAMKHRSARDSEPNEKSNERSHAEGWLITRREPMLGPGVTINGRTTATGSITAEILDRKNRVVPGFSRKECVAFTGDSVNHLLTWPRDRFPDRASRDYKLRFWLQDAELFSYLPTQLDPAEPDLARFPSSGP